MIGRRQLAVASPISSAAVARAFVESVVAGEGLATRASALVAERLDVPSVVLADSGTSALVMALRLAVPPGGIVGFPAFACVDLAAAARFAGVRVRVYDISPETLGPDLASLDRMLERGVDAVVVAHLYGFPADVPGVRARAATFGIPVIEDAAQAAGAALHGKPLGTFGDLGVLSFGRGKGLCAGGGGALLATSAAWAARLDALRVAPSGAGWGGLAKTAAQWLLGRPSLYALPSMIPWLRLGEMVFHPAHEPRRMSRGSCALLSSAFDLEKRDLVERRMRGSLLQQSAREVIDVRAVSALPGAEPSFLRFPVVDVSRRRTPRPALGVLRSYPATMAEQQEMQPLLLAGEPPMPGAVELRDTLFTLPTHQFVTESDMAALAEWLRASRVSARDGAVPAANTEISRV